MKFQSMYTNTSSGKAIIGLLLVTLATAYIQQNATEIVDSIKSATKSGVQKVDELRHHGQKQYAVAERLYNGDIRDTGKRIWR